MGEARRLRYSIIDPTGNITALVEDEVAVDEQPAVAAQVMERHPEVEQVGFVRPAASEEGVQGELRMAGGEFCGNATMSAAALLRLRGEDGCEGEPSALRLRSSGAARPVEVHLTPADEGGFATRICMPAATSIEDVRLSFGQVSATVPVVFMEGISHAVITSSSPFFALREAPAEAEQAVRAWCAELGTDGLGLMFVEAGEPDCAMVPLVYVPAANTVFWENSCASGSASVGMCLAAQRGAACALSLHEPGGVLRVESDPAGSTWLFGHARLVGEYTL